MKKSTKTLLWVAGLGAVAYYFYQQNQASANTSAQIAASNTGASGATGNSLVQDVSNLSSDVSQLFSS